MNKVNYLRNIVANLGSIDLTSNLKPDTQFTITESWLQDIPFVKAKFSVTGQVVGIKKEGARSLYHLSDAIFTGSDDYQRGTTFDELFNEVSDFIIKKFGEWNSSAVSDAEVRALDERIATWFREKAVSARLYIPCGISTVYAAPFSVGPISFSHINDFFVRERPAIEQFDVFLKPLLNLMQTHMALWMATVDVNGCISNRAGELGDLAVDIALAGLQLVIPPDDSKRMARLTARTLLPVRQTAAVLNGQISGSATNQQAGFRIGPGALERWLGLGGPIIKSVGNRVAGYLSGKMMLPKIEQAWCDAAFWYHEGLAEPLDTIAVPKLETAAEVLLVTESSKGSKARLLQAMKAFYGLDAKQPINPGSLITVGEFAYGLVRDRSRILHGTWSTLSAHMRASRSDLTALVRGLLVACALDIDTFASDAAASDDPKQFLDWALARRQTNP